MTLPEWGRKVLLLAIIPLPQINKEKFTESENQVLTPDVIRHRLKIRIISELLSNK